MTAPDLRLDGQAAIVTGASTGLGVIIAQALAAQGCAVVLAARRIDLLRRVADDIASAGGRAVPVVCDVRDPSHADMLAERCVTAFGRLDGVVANAGIAGGGPAEHEDSATFAEVMAVNVVAAAAIAGACARRMIPAGGGWVILQSSILGQRAGDGRKGVTGSGGGQAGASLGGRRLRDDDAGARRGPGHDRGLTVEPEVGGGHAGAMRSATATSTGSLGSRTRTRA